MKQPKGTLTVAGTGILPVGHLTQEASQAIQIADRVFYAVTNPLMARMILRLNPGAEDLRPLYGKGKPREKTYAEMVAALLKPVRQGKRVCAAFYGHPGVFVISGHEAIRQARAAGHQAEMLPGISAEDCLFADLNVDPARDGCATFEATDLLLSHRTWDATSALVIWQISVIGEMAYPTSDGRKNLPVLIERLREVYPASHLVTVYEASSLPGFASSVHRCPLGRLARAPLTHFSTLYVPPLPGRRYDRALLQRLGMMPRKKASSSGRIARSLASTRCLR